MLIIGALRKLLASIGKGQTFDPANSTRLRSVGVTVMAAGPVFGFLHFLIARDLIGSSEVLRTSVQPRLDLHLITVLLGLLIVIIGRAFEVGSRLQSDRDLTI